MAKVHRLSTQVRIEIRDGWKVHLVTANSVTDPSELARIDEPPLSGEVPGTVASALRKAGRHSAERGPIDKIDAWYVCSFVFNPDLVSDSDLVRLVFDGLATIADVWLNGIHLLRSENMFLSHEIDVSAVLQRNNEICVRFSSLDEFIEHRRPRGRWRSKMVDNHQLRWARTTLMGRIPRCNQNLHVVGPWRPISVVIDRVLSVEKADFRVSINRGAGLVKASVTVRPQGGEITSARLKVGEHVALLGSESMHEGTILLQGEIEIPDVERWWPHTHGRPALYKVSVELVAGDQPVAIDFGSTGFRDISVDTMGGGFSVSINGEHTFLRGACWTPIEITTLTVDEAGYCRPLGLALEAGMNMLRVTGDMYYESDAFYDQCAKLGIALWQDYAFALMDYPAQDEHFCESVSLEARQLLDRLQLNPALAVVCGNSDVEMQAAMMGLGHEEWKSPLFYELLANATSQARPDLIYLPSSPTGGALPFHVDSGVASYYGIGIYMRPLDDARRSSVRFAAECLAFGNIPEDETIDEYLATGEAPGPHPSWKAGVPRETGVGIDYDDIRDFYTRILFGDDLNHARFYDRQRYLELGRVTTGEVMAATFSEWRRSGSSCGGALVWNFRDIIPGAGWGLIDACGRPKSSYYYLKRILTPLGLFFTDEGSNGLHLHIVNERATSVAADLRLALYRDGNVCVYNHHEPITVSARSATEMSVDGLIGHFLDTSYAYRFGPPTHDITVAELSAISHKGVLARAFHFPAGMQFPRLDNVGLKATALRCCDGKYKLAVKATKFAQAVHIDIRGYTADDNYFHIEPGSEHTTFLIPNSVSSGGFSGYVDALNSVTPVKIAIMQNNTDADVAQ